MVLKEDSIDDNGSLSRPLLEEDDIVNADDGIIMVSSNISIGAGSLQISAAVTEEEFDERSRGDLRPRYDNFKGRTACRK